MGKVFIRVEKIHTVSLVSKAAKHNAREAHFENADPSKAKENKIILEQNEPFDRFFKKRILHQQKTRNQKIKSNAVRAFQVVVSVQANESMSNPLFIIDDFASIVSSFMKRTFGQENIYQIVLHMDESAPHIHVLIVPMTSDKRLCYRDLLGTPEKLNQMLDSFNKDLEIIGLYQTRRKNKYDFRTHEQYKKDVLEAQTDSLPYPEPYYDLERYGEVVNREFNKQKSFYTQTIMTQNVEIIRLKEDNSALKEQLESLKTTPAEQRVTELFAQIERMKESIEDLEMLRFAIEHRSEVKELSDEAIIETLHNMCLLSATGRTLKKKSEATRAAEIMDDGEYDVAEN